MTDNATANADNGSTPMVPNRTTPSPPAPSPLGLDGDVADSEALISRVGHEPAKPAFIASLKAFGWWLFIPMIVIGGLIGSIVGMLGYFLVTGSMGFSFITTQVGTPITITPGLLSATTVTSLVFTGIASVVFFILKWRRYAPDAVGSLAWMDNGKRSVWWKALIGVGIGVLFYLTYMLVSWLLMFAGVNTGSSDTGNTVSDILHSMIRNGGAWGWTGIVLTLVCVCVLNPISEEFIFRGIIGRRLVDSTLLRDNATAKRSWWQSLLVCLLAGLFFGVVHFTSVSMAGLLPVLLTTLFGALCVWLSSIATRSLWVSIGAHVAFNSIQMILLMISLLA